MPCARFSPVAAFATLLLLASCASESLEQPSADARRPASPLGSPSIQPTTRQAPLLDGLGSHERRITTASPLAQRYFNQGLILAYSFNHPEAERSFREAARLDPDCAMAWWGVAWVLGPNINIPMNDSAVPRAYEAVRKAEKLSDRCNETERAMIVALTRRYAQQPTTNRSDLDLAFADAMRDVAKRYPNDLDIATIFAESLMDTMAWDYWTRDGQPKPATAELLAALESVMQRDPKHPGANHYYIHAVEAVHPERGVAAADRLANLCPSAGHMVHMPSHIYARVGLYREAVIANERAAAADENYISQCRAQGMYPALYYPHNVHFLWYALTMEGRADEAIAAARKVQTHVCCTPGALEGPRLTALPLIAMARFGRWDDVLKAPAPQAAEKDAFVKLNTHYARGLAQVAKPNLDEAERELTQLSAILDDDSKRKGMDNPHFPGTKVGEIARHDLAGRLAIARGQTEKGIAELETAVKLEDDMPYMEPPFWYFPMRHILGAALLDAGKPKEAEAVYRADLKKNPLNGWSLLGLAQSLKAQGKDESAAEVRRQYDFAWMRADHKPKNSAY